MTLKELREAQDGLGKLAAKTRRRSGQRYVSAIEFAVGMCIEVCTRLEDQTAAIRELAEAVREEK